MYLHETFLHICNITCIPINIECHRDVDKGYHGDGGVFAIVNSILIPSWKIVGCVSIDIEYDVHIGAP